MLKICISVLLCCSVSGGGRVLRSAGKRPKWLYGSGEIPIKTRNHCLFLFRYFACAIHLTTLLLATAQPLISFGGYFPYIFCLSFHLQSFVLRQSTPSWESTFYIYRIQLPRFIGTNKMPFLPFLCIPFSSVPNILLYWTDDSGL